MIFSAYHFVLSSNRDELSTRMSKCKVRKRAAEDVKQNEMSPEGSFIWVGTLKVLLRKYSKG